LTATPSWVSNSSGENTITEAENINEKQFGNQAATLEMFALRLPFLLIPNQLCKCHICIFTDKMPCVFGMKDGCVKNDEYAARERLI
jgi:hypothetical protein